MLSSMQELINSLTTMMKQITDELSTKFKELVESNRFLEASSHEDRVEATDAIQQVKTLTTKVKLQNMNIEHLKK